jgi:hypothetical protein
MMDNDYAITDFITGGSVIGGATTYSNKHTDLPKDNTIAELIPEQVSECALYLGKDPGEPCASDSTVQTIGNIIGVNGDGKTVLNEAKNKLGCDTEACVLKKLEDKIGRDAVRAEVKIHMKIQGPTDTSLLSNYDIDNTLSQWTNKFGDFYPYNFNMLNYISYSFVSGEVLNRPDTLATVLWKDIYGGRFGKKYRCCGCIINSDKYQGGGKHWMALFADARRNDKWTVEFFNSSGNAPAPEWINWLVKTRDQMEEIAASEKKKVKVEIVKVCNIRHQQSRTECGVYSLFYIWSRLNGTPYDYFMNTPVPDQHMMEFRQHLFNGPQKTINGVFDFDQYKKTTNVEWE